MALATTTPRTTTPITAHTTAVRGSATSRPPAALQLLRESLRQEAATGTTAGFSAAQLALLTAPLNRDHVRQREQGRS